LPVPIGAGLMAIAFALAGLKAACGIDAAGDASE